MGQLVTVQINSLYNVLIQVFNSLVIDLTNEKQQHQQQAAADSYESEDIRKAIAASLQDSTGMLGGQVTREEQDISR